VSNISGTISYGKNILYEPNHYPYPPLNIAESATLEFNVEGDLIPNPRKMCIPLHLCHILIICDITVPLFHLTNRNIPLEMRPTQVAAPDSFSRRRS
jgi:hypothetical protein